MRGASSPAGAASNSAGECGSAHRGSPPAFLREWNGEDPTVDCALGDEDWVSVLAARLFVQRYVFFTDPTFATSNLVIMRVRGATGFSEVSCSTRSRMSSPERSGATAR